MRTVSSRTAWQPSESEPPGAESLRAVCAASLQLTAQLVGRLYRYPVYPAVGTHWQQQQALKDLMGNSSELRNLKAFGLTDEKFGKSRQHRHYIIAAGNRVAIRVRNLKTAQFVDGVETMNDLQPRSRRR
ncbi:hypothetical protein MJ581_19710 [Escherichia coli]|nr:hypothetical protein MJ581_19710 [Escherichia coli]